MSRWRHFCSSLWAFWLRMELNRVEKNYIQNIWHLQKMKIYPADATSVRKGCVCPMRPVRPDRPPDVFSHPMCLVPPNALISPPMDPARLLPPPSVLTAPLSFPSSTAVVWRHWAYPSPIPSTQTTCPLPSPSGDRNPPCGIWNRPPPLSSDPLEPLFFISYQPTTHRGITIVILFLLPTIV